MKKVLISILLILATVFTMCGCDLFGGSGTPMLKINGTEITQFQIVYSASAQDDFAKSVAKDLAERLAAKYGQEITACNDKQETAAHEILIGDTNRDVSEYVVEYLSVEEYSISSNGAHVAITAGGHKGLVSAVEEFFERIGLEKEGKDSPANVTIGIEDYQVSKLYSAMSFNILYTYDEKRWAVVMDTILKYMPDSVGMQETTPQWNMYIPFVKKFTDVYEMVSFPYRDGSGGTNELICYRKDRFKLISKDTKWVSNTPDMISKVDGATLYRIINFVVLEDLETGEQIVHANTHLEHQVAMANVAQVECLKDILEPYRGQNIIVTGDFNASHNDGDGLGSEDTYFSDPKYHADYVTKRPTTGGTSAIDFCWTARDTIDAKYYHVATEMMPIGDGNKKMQPSDHRPVFVVYDLASN